MGEVGSESKEMECAEKSRLLCEYTVAMDDYGRAVRALATKAGVMKKSEYTKIREYVNKARLKSESAYTELDRHTAEHGC